MPDHRSKRPMPAVMDVATFHRKFGSEEACWEHLRITLLRPHTSHPRPQRIRKMKTRHALLR